MFYGRPLTSSRFTGYRQFSSDRGAYENVALYAYDNPSANNDGSPSICPRSRSQCGGGGGGGQDRNPTFVLEPAAADTTYYQQTADVTATSLSLPYLRRAGDYSNYFSPQESPVPLERPSTLEVCLYTPNSTLFLFSLVSHSGAMPPSPKTTSIERIEKRGIQENCTQFPVLRHSRRFSFYFFTTFLHLILWYFLFDVPS